MIVIVQSKSDTKCGCYFTTRSWKDQ